MKRRTVLAFALGGLGWAWLAPGGARAWFPGATAGGLDRWAQRLVRTLRRPASAAAVGRVYLAKRPAEGDASRLAATIAADLGRGARFDPVRASRAALRAKLGERVRRDFADGRTVEVEGWVLAATEARLFGLAALAQRRSV